MHFILLGLLSPLSFVILIIALVLVAFMIYLLQNRP